MDSITLDFQPTPAPPSVRHLVELRPLARRDDGYQVLLASYPDHHLFALQSC